VERPRLRWKVLDAVAAAAVEMGVKAVADFNAADVGGVGYFHVNQKRGVRWSAARAFLKPALRRPNLRLETHALTERILFDGARAAGVRFRRRDGETFEVRTSGEVILCAGAIGTPVILQRSGVGPAEWLAERGIEITLHRPGVGRNLQDHLQQRAIYKITGARTLNTAYHAPARRALMGLQYGLLRSGPLTMAPSQLGIFTTSSAEHERPNIEFHVQPLSLDKFGDPLHRFDAITVSACNLRPTSRGEVRIRAAAADNKPFIAPYYLSTSEDVRVAANAIRVTRRLMRQNSLARFQPQEYLSGRSVGDDQAALVQAAGDIGTTIFHPVGTARMGLPSDSMAVTDARLRCIGLQNLRIVDASVMPTITSGNTNTPTVMIGERGAIMTLEDRKS
jgi:choline dehydrogenase-like flavoprotein